MLLQVLLGVGAVYVTYRLGLNLVGRRRCAQHWYWPLILC